MPAKVTVAARGGDVRPRDYSRQAGYESSDPAGAAVSDDGVIATRGNGKAEIRVHRDL